MKISTDLHVKCPFFKKWNKKEINHFFLWNFHMVFGEQIAISYQFFKSRSSNKFFRRPQFTRVPGKMSFTYRCSHPFHQYMIMSAGHHQKTQAVHLNPLIQFSRCYCHQSYKHYCRQDTGYFLLFCCICSAVKQERLSLVLAVKKKVKVKARRDK